MFVQGIFDEKLCSEINGKMWMFERQTFQKTIFARGLSGLLFQLRQCLLMTY